MNHDSGSDLAYIRQMMAETRRAACLSGGYFIVWGLAVGVGLLATWLQLRSSMGYYPLLTWSPCFAVGIAGNIYFACRDSRDPVQTPAGRMIGMVWTAIGITMLIFFYAGLGAQALPDQHLPAVFSSLVGSGVFLTGVLAGLPWLRNLAFGWWLGSLVMFVWPGAHVILLMGLMLLGLYVIPGIVLTRMKRQLQSAAGV